MIPNHLLWPPEPAAGQQGSDDNLSSAAEDEADWHTAHPNAIAVGNVAASFRTTFGPGAAEAAAAFREMLKATRTGQRRTAPARPTVKTNPGGQALAVAQGLPTLPVARPIDTTDIDLPRIVVEGGSSGDARAKPAAAAEVARHDTVALASGGGSRGGASGGGTADSAARGGDIGPGLGGVIGSARPVAIQNLTAPYQADVPDPGGHDAAVQQQAAAQRAARNAAVADPFTGTGTGIDGNGWATPGAARPGSATSAILAGMRQAAAEPDTGIQLAQAGKTASGAPPNLLPADFGSEDIPDPNDVVPGGPWTPATGQRPLTFFGPQQPGGRVFTRWVPQGEDGPPGSVGYWKTKTPKTPWVRFDQSGQPITSEQAHPNPRPASTVPGLAVPETPAGSEVPEIPELPIIPP